MKVSVIIPARDAADTIAETFQSLQEQTQSDWEAIVIDDGSSDDTAEIARRQSETDPRFRLIQGDAAGVGAARNKGLQHASADWILFLDADDWIKPTHLEKMTAKLAPDVGGAYCGYARVAEDGTVFGETRCWQPNSLFEEFAQTCLWTVHACVVRKDLILQVGGFLPGWKTCEDWDLWQRITRTGARFKLVDETLALYRMRPGSASLDATDMVRGAIETINRGHGPDPRVKSPKPEYADGMPAEGAARARLLAITWSAALLIGHERDGREALAPVKSDRDPGLEPWFVGSNLFWGVLLPTCRTAEAWVELLPQHSERIDQFLDELEEVSGAPRLARRARQHLEDLVMKSAPPDQTGVLGRTRTVNVEVTEAIRDVTAGPGVERVACRILLEGRTLGTLHLPAWDSRVTAAVLADAIADDFWHPIVSRYLDDAVYGTLARTRHPMAWVARRLVRALTRRLPGRQEDFEQWATLSIDWVAFLSELFDSRKAPAPAGPVSRLEIELGHPIPNVRVAGGILDVSVTCGGCPVGRVTIPAPSGRASARRVRHALKDACGLELARLAVREAILGQPIDGAMPLSEALAMRADSADEAAHHASAGGATLLVDGAPDNAIGTSASRRVELPAPLRQELIHSFPRPAADGFPRAAVDVAPSPRRVRDIAARFLERAVPSFRRRSPHQAIADRLPILMFHRIADDGPVHLTPWRVAPSQFEDQLRCLRDRGYYSVSLEEWRTAKDRRRQLRGRPVLLTFDDGYEDFAEVAWPLLRKYGFSAVVFLVADRIGRTNDWDIGYGDEVPLMGWSTLRRLQREGVEFGSHTSTHPPLSALSAEDVVKQGLGARRVLEEGLGRRIDSIAYPYGDYDSVVRHLIGGCGYRFGLTCRADVSRYSDPLLELPRFNVDPALTLEALIQRMELRNGDVVE